MRRRVAAAAVIIVIVLVVSGSGYYIYQDTRSPAQSSNPGSSSGTSTASATGTATTVGSGATSQSGGASSSSGLAAGNGNWTTYHGDNARTGDGPSSNFTSIQLSWKSTRLDGSIYAEPLILGGAVFVATEGDTASSLAAGTGVVLWQRHLGTPVPGGELPCGDINPSGVTGTPVIDASTQTLYVVAFVSLHHVLFALDLRSGAVLSQQNVDPTSPSGFDPSVEQQRGALTLANGMVYIPYGGLDGDCGQYHGWVVGVPINGTAATMVAYQVPTSMEGGIWAPSGASVDPAGNLYVATGNGASDATYDSGDSVIKLSPSLIPEGSFAPTDWAQLNRDDVDLGSVGPALLDGGSLVFQIGKGGTGYILHADELGGIGGQVYLGPGLWGRLWRIRGDGVLAPIPLRAVHRRARRASDRERHVQPGLDYHQLRRGTAHSNRRRRLGSGHIVGRDRCLQRRDRARSLQLSTHGGRRPLLHALGG